MSQGALQSSRLLTTASLALPWTRVAHQAAPLAESWVVQLVKVLPWYLKGNWQVSPLSPWHLVGPLSYPAHAL